jgi:hypothetical protein
MFDAQSPDVTDPISLQAYYQSINVSRFSHFDNVVNMGRFKIELEWSKLGKPWDWDVWYRISLFWVLSLSNLCPGLDLPPPSTHVRYLPRHGLYSAQANLYRQGTIQLGTRSISQLDCSNSLFSHHRCHSISRMAPSVASQGTSSRTPLTRLDDM